MIAFPPPSPSSSPPMPPKSKSPKASKNGKAKTSHPTEDLPSPPTEINPYTVLAIPNTATAAEIRSAYRKLALQWHPDKHQDNKEEANVKFQEIAFAYAVLNDETRRRRYDNTGSLEEVEEGDFDWKSYFQELWDGIVNGDTIKDFLKTYQGVSLNVRVLTVGTEEEAGDVLQAYEDGEGSVQFIIDTIMGCSYEDEPRFIKLVNDAIKEGKVEEFPKWKKDTNDKAVSKRKKAAEKEAKEAEEWSKELGLNKPASKMDEGELGQLIMQRQKGRLDSLLEKLEAEAMAKAEKKVKRKGHLPQESAQPRKGVHPNKKRKT
jgi:DnaJ homolog subfamily C member 9